MKLNNYLFVTNILRNNEFFTIFNTEYFRDHLGMIKQANIHLLTTSSWIQVKRNTRICVSNVKVAYFVLLPFVFLGGFVAMLAFAL
jgi:hypothetical protein